MDVSSIVWYKMLNPSAFDNFVCGFCIYKQFVYASVVQKSRGSATDTEQNMNNCSKCATVEIIYFDYSCARVFIN